MSTTGAEQVSTACCVAGGGPAGMMLGLLLARAGVEVVVLEKHADFLRDFRGDTIHPSTLQVLHELGLLDRFLRLPYQKVERLAVSIGDEILPVADFTHLPTRCRFVAFMPQWHFLDFLAGEAAHAPTFTLRMRTEVTDLIHEGGDIVGVRAAGPDGALTIRARLVVGADGRTSLVRERAGLSVDELGAPMDVLWFRLSRRQTDGVETMGRIAPGRFLVMLDRGDYWQCGFVIPKGTIDRLRAAGLEAFRGDVTRVVPFVADRVAEIASWDDVKLLTVQVEPSPALEPSRPAVHRRRGPRHVAGRRSRHQPGDPGRGGRGESPHGAAAERPRHPGRSRRGPATARVAHARHAAPPDAGAGGRGAAGPRSDRPDHSAARAAAARSVPDPAATTRASHRAGGAARARHDRALRRGQSSSRPPDPTKRSAGSAKSTLKVVRLPYARVT